MKYKRFNRNGGTTEHTAVGLTLVTRDGKHQLIGRKREGKTEKDHRSGSWGARHKNRAARVEWQQDRNAS